MLHTSDSITMFGPLASSSAEVIEKRHVSVKRLADRTNQRKDWKMQILIHEERQDETNFTLLDDALPLEFLSNECRMETGQRNQAIAAFADSIHSTQCARHRY